MLTKNEIQIKRVKVFYMWAKLRYPSFISLMTVRNYKLFFYLIMKYFILRGIGYRRTEILTQILNQNYYPIDIDTLAYLIVIYLECEKNIIKPICTVRWDSAVELYLMTPQGKIGKDTYIVHLETEKIYPWTTYVYSTHGQRYSVDRIKSVDGIPFNLSMHINANAIYPK